MKVPFKDARGQLRLFSNIQRNTISLVLLIGTSRLLFLPKVINRFIFCPSITQTGGIFASTPMIPNSSTMTVAHS